MIVAKVLPNGQITIPVDIRRLLGLDDGDRVMFVRMENGEFIFGKAPRTATLDTKKPFDRAA